MKKDKLYNYPAKVVRVVDGDTMVIELDMAFGRTWTTNFRIYQEAGFYFDTPETKRYRGVTEEHLAHGFAATDRAKELLMDKQIFVHTHKHGSFRYLAQIFLEDGRDYAEVMKEEGFQKLDVYDDDLP